MKRVSLLFFDGKQGLKENFYFIRNIIKNSSKSLLISILFVGLLILLDFLAREFKTVLLDSSKTFFNNIGNLLIRFNDLFGLKFLDYFKDVIVIVAGILGIILGLFFTTFLNIITSKYSNINSTIVNQLIKQKVINKYFNLLAILVATSILFQFLLIIGYHPTVISSFLFTISVIITILAFIFYGRYTLIYFNAGNLALDLTHSNNQILTRAFKNKTYFDSEKGYQILLDIRRNLETIRLIAEESSKPQLSNTALDAISKEVLEFAIRYNAFKHTFPSNKGWHPKTQKYKRWEEASSTEFEFFNRTGATLYPVTIDDFNAIEKQLINTQYYIFNRVESTSDYVQLINNQYKYLQVIAFQCDLELFDLFFDELETFIEKRLVKTNPESNETSNLQLVSLYAILQIQYLVGFNHNFEKIINKEILKKFAYGIHSFKNTDTIMQFPYKIRIWMDKYQEMLRNEFYNEKKILTPLFYTEFELANQFQNIFKNHIEKVSENIIKRVLAFAKNLRDKSFPLESLEFLIESLDVQRKIDFFSGIVENKIANEINPLNLIKEEEFIFNERASLLIKNGLFRKKMINEIWDLGLSSYSIKNTDLPDIYGNFYQIICEDIIDKSFESNANQLIKYLPHFYTYNILYIESLRNKIDNKRLEYTTSKLFPLIVDLFEISSITIIKFIGYDNIELKNSFFKFWDTLYKGDAEKERNFWGMILPIYEYFNQPIFGLSTPSYVKEYRRRDRLEEFLKKSNLVRIEEINGTMLSFMQHYVTDIDDIYFKEIVRKLSVDRISNFMSGELAEVFIEYFLRTRVALKELKIKETRYGEDIRRSLEKDT
ncbi:MAG: hypothetical protein JW866_03075 [Ignavibacteriales bacterium]|nr:hypothetical protein [Ignavibacteriales bacterium]